MMPVITNPAQAIEKKQEQIIRLWPQKKVMKE